MFAWFNLATNAIKHAFAEKESGQVRVTIRQSDNRDVTVNLGLILEILGRQEEAIPILEKAIAQDAKNRDLYASLSRCYEQVGMEEQSQAAAKKYSELSGP